MPTRIKAGVPNIPAKLRTKQHVFKLLKDLENYYNALADGLDVVLSSEGLGEEYGDVLNQLIYQQVSILNSVKDDLEDAIDNLKELHEEVSLSSAEELFGGSPNRDDSYVGGGRCNATKKHGGGRCKNRTTKKYCKLHRK